MCKIVIMTTHCFVINFFSAAFVSWTGISKRHYILQGASESCFHEEQRRHRSWENPKADWPWRICDQRTRGTLLPQEIQSYEETLLRTRALINDVFCHKCQTICLKSFWKSVSDVLQLHYNRFGHKRFFFTITTSLLHLAVNCNESDMFFNRYVC